MEKNIHDDALLIHLTVTQMRDVLESVFLQSSTRVNNQSEVLDIGEVSKLTGYKIPTIYKLTHERRIPFHKPAHGGRRIFFKRTEINQWLQSNRIETNEEFLQNHGKGNKIEENGMTRLPKQLSELKALRELFIAFLGIINNYKTRIQELEKKVCLYEKDNQFTENLLINDIETQKN